MYKIDHKSKENGNNKRIRGLAAIYGGCFVSKGGIYLLTKYTDKLNRYFKDNVKNNNEPDNITLF